MYDDGTLYVTLGAGLHAHSNPLDPIRVPPPAVIFKKRKIFNLLTKTQNTVKIAVKR